jgi:hypothetical protein
MTQVFQGRIKWFRHDGTGYVETDTEPRVTFYLDKSAFYKPWKGDTPIESGTPVVFSTFTILGKKVATDVRFV